MAIKPSGSLCPIREQIIEDPVTGLSIQFIARPDTDAPIRMVIFGAMPDGGSREILFDADGNEAGAGSSLGASCRPNWLREVQS